MSCVLFPARARRRCLSCCWSAAAFVASTASSNRCFSDLGPPPEAPPSLTSPQRVLIVDSDAGVDAAVAIMIAMQSKADSMVLTSVFGNTALCRATTNLCMLRSLFAKDAEVPVFPGAETSMLGRASKHQWQVHGSSGLGE